MYKSKLHYELDCMGFVPTENDVGHYELVRDFGKNRVQYVFLPKRPSDSYAVITTFLNGDLDSDLDFVDEEELLNFLKKANPSQDFPSTSG